MFRLTPHGQTPPVEIGGVSLMWMELGGGQHQLTWRFENAARLLVPMRMSRERADDLWQMTCCELFLRKQAGPAYFEFNFSPSQRWAAYQFKDYREGRTDFPLASPPMIEAGFEGEAFVQRVLVSGLPEGMTAAGASAVVVERSRPDPVQSDSSGDEAGEATPAQGKDQPDEKDQAEEETPWVPVTSLWAINHPSARPDFHHPGSYMLPLAPGFR